MDVSGAEPFWKDGSIGHAKYTQHWIPYLPIALDHVGYSSEWPRVARISSPNIPQNNSPQNMTTAEY